MKRIVAVLTMLILITGITLAYTVTVKIGESGIEMTHEEGYKVKLTPKVEIEYWEVESGGVTINNNEFTMPAQDVVIKAVLPRPRYTITYDANGGTGAPSSQTKIEGVDLTLSNDSPTKTGYSFFGWSTDRNAVSPTYQPGGTFTIDSNTTLYAVYGALITSTAGSGGSISPSGEEVYSLGSNKTYTITPDVGYKVKDVKVDGVSQGMIRTYTFTNIRETHTIEATFEETYSVTIVSQASSGGNITPEGPYEVLIGSDQDYNIVADSGYAICDIIVDGVSIEFTATDGAYTYTFENVTEAHSIRAVFAASTYQTDTYNLTVNPNGGTYNSSTSNTVHSGTYNTTVELINPVHQNVFTVTYDANSGVCDTEEFRTKAFDYWTKAEEYGTIVYNNNSKATYTYGTGNATITANYKNDDVVLPDATKNGYVLDGWYTAATDGTKVGNVGDTYTATSDITLYAVWTANTTVNLTYNSNYGTVTTVAVSIPSGERLPQNTFSRDGYAFLGWNTEANGSGTSYIDRAIYSGATDVTLYAQWQEAESYTVTVQSDSGMFMSGTQRVGETVILTAEDNVSDGAEKTINWSSTDVTLSATIGSETSFIMPSKDVTIYQTSVVTTEEEEEYTEYTLTTSTDGYTETIRKVSAGESVTLTATPRIGESIIAWEATGVTLSAYVGPEVTFIMPENDVTVRAIPGKYTLTTQLASIYMSGGQTAGETVTLTASRIEGMSFVGWEATGLVLPNPINETITFTMPYNDVTLVGSYETYTLTSSETSAEPTVENVTAGNTVTLTAVDGDGESFLKWDVTGITLPDDRSRTITFTMPYNDVVITPIYGEYILTIYMDETVTEQYPSSGDTITLTAEAENGRTFVGWEATGVTLTDATNTTISFVMPYNHVEVRAVYNKYTLTTNIAGTYTSAYQKSGSTVTLTTGQVTGMTFTGWTATGVTLANPTSLTISFEMPENDVEITANYVESTE